MLYLLFGNQKTPMPAEVTMIKAGVLKIRAQEQITENLNGFKLFIDKQMKHMVGDYTAYKTQYCDTDAGCIFLSTGEVYEAPPREEIPEPTPEEIAAQKLQRRIEELQAQIAAHKAQIDATDYRIVKAYEYSMVGLEAEYDMEALHEERQSFRDAINGLEEEIQKIRGKGEAGNE